MQRVLSLALGLTALATAGSAQTMEFGCPKPGTTFLFDSGTTITARARDDMDCAMQIVGGPAFKVRGLLFANPAPDGSDTSSFIAALKPERLGRCRWARRTRPPTAPAAAVGPMC